MLGVTISLNDKTVDENIKYLKEMKELGCELVFTSLRIPEEDPNTIKESVELIGEYIEKNYTSFVVDVSPRAFNLFTIEWMKKNHIDTLRIDNGISEEEIISLNKNFKIIFNASILTDTSITKLRELGFTEEIIAWHNYYPRKNTGLDEAYFAKQNKILLQNNVKLGAYIPGDLVARGTIYEWLPTLEKHRYISPFASYLEMSKVFQIDTVILGDYGLTEKTKEQFKKFFQDKTILLEATEVTESKILNTTFQNRMDIASEVIRSVEIKKSLQDKIPPLGNERSRSIGDITLDNLFYGRYMGELQIVLTPLPVDSRVNIVGHIVERDLTLLPFVKYNRYKYQFKMV